MDSTSQGDGDVEVHLAAEVDLCDGFGGAAARAPFVVGDAATLGW